MQSRLATWSVCARSLWLLAAVILVPGLVGCQAIVYPSENAGNALEEMLRPAEAAHDGVTLEIIQLRVPVDDQEITDELWQVVDEQRLDVNLRHRLISNGFRAGVVSGSLPDALSRRLNLQSEMVEPEAERLITSLSARPRVVRRVLQLGPRDPATIQTTELRNTLHVVLRDKNAVHSRSFRQAQPVYTLQAEAAIGQRVALQLTPEVQHGEMRNRYAGGDSGIFMMSPSREREVYQELSLKVNLAVGEMLVLGCLPDEAGSLGYDFHTLSGSEPTEFKLVLVRLFQVPSSEILADGGLAAR